MTWPRQYPRIPAATDDTWRAKANCRGVAPDLFFPERGESTTDARRVCAGCVVREECLDYALTDSGTVGIWGGKSERERRRMRRARQRGAA